MPNEIERRWLVDDKKAEFIIRAFKAEGHSYWQGYISELGSKSAVRIRSQEPADPKQPTEYFLTMKSGEGLVRGEINIELTPERFVQLKNMILGMNNGYLDKKRYKIQIGGKTIELDVFEGRLVPLCIAEVEFQDEQSANDFIPPPWFGDEITKSRDYSNMALAWKGLPNG